MKKLLKLVLASAMTVSLFGCSSGSDSSSTATTGLTTWNTYQTQANEMETWNVLYSQSAAELNVVTNFIDSLLTHDTKGNLVANLASEWSSNDDATEWTFKLNEGVKWVDYEGNEKGEVTAADFVTGLEYVLNYAKNSGANSSMPREMIAGADEYYEMTSAEYEETGAVSAETEAKFLDIVGISTPDDYTVVYTMIAPKPYFDTLATYAPLYPLAQGCLDEYGEDYGTDNTTIWYNGPYLCSEYVNQSYKTLVQNPSWWNADNYTRFEQVNIQMVESSDQAWSLYQSGELDYIQLPESAVIEVSKSGEGSEYYSELVQTRPDKYAYVLRFNYEVKLDDGSLYTDWNTAIANENFRDCWYYGIDWTDYCKRVNSLDPQSIMNDTYTSNGLVFTSDGTDYTDLVRENLGQHTTSDMVGHDRLDADKYEECKAAAIEELTAEGVSLPVTYYMWYKSGNSTGADTAAVFKQIVEEQLDGLVVVELKTYTESASSEVYKPQLHSGTMSGWGADYGDPINYLGQEIDDTNAFYNYNYEHRSAATDPDFATFCDMVAEADALTDLDARYTAFAEAEAYLIDKAYVIPLYIPTYYEITKVNDYSKIYSPYGMQQNRYLNWETSDVAYTTEQYAEFAKDAA